jgi:hypothetical protein
MEPIKHRRSSKRSLEGRPHPRNDHSPGAEHTSNPAEYRDTRRAFTCRSCSSTISGEPFGSHPRRTPGNVTTSGCSSPARLPPPSATDCQGGCNGAESVPGLDQDAQIHNISRRNCSVSATASRPKERRPAANRSNTATLPWRNGNDVAARLPALAMIHHITVLITRDQDHH